MNKEMNQKTFLILFVVIVIIAFFMRFYMLDIKVLHHDEGVEQNIFIQPLLESKGLVWDYDRKGLAYHFLSSIFINKLGLSTFSLRFTPALFGSLTVLLLFFLKDYIGKVGVLFSSIFLAVSPIFIYYSRFYSAWPFFDFFLLLLLITVFKFIKKSSLDTLCLIFLLIAILLNLILEAFIIFIFIAFSYIYLNYLLDPNFREEFWHFLKQISVKELILGLFVLIAVFITIQSSFFLQFSNIIKLTTVFSDLAKKAIESGHNKPFFYYFTILYPFEIGLLLISLVGLIFFKKDKISAFFIYWSLASLFIFSLISYKTNWTLTVIIFPLFLLAGNTLDYLIKRFPRQNKKILIVALIFILLSLYFGIEQNYLSVNNFKVNKIGYVETSTDIYRLIQDIKDYENLHKNAKILISAQSYWPLPVYLNNFSVWYESLTETNKLELANYPDYAIFIANKDQLDKVAENFETKEYELRQNYYLTVLYKK